MLFLALTDVVTILTEAAESEVLYPNYHGCKMLKILCGYVFKIGNFKDSTHTVGNGLRAAQV